MPQPYGLRHPGRDNPHGRVWSRTSRAGPRQPCAARPGSEARTQGDSANTSAIRPAAASNRATTSASGASR
ncbi:hypothetical protein KMB26_00060 [Streptomyces sp. CYG20]|uniref:hypothetical protein n=1 Tax=Streptomyces sp. CYG20 TaxID=2838873 RepID=UPI001BFFB841|nr:hypothetical protein [Streptomyces sp. CYG20]MBT3107783.1 hypothetical protein [Streptomyces sp. CYG20]